MTGEPQTQQYDLTLTTAGKPERTDVRRTRYNPWLIGLQISASLVLPFAVGQIAGELTADAVKVWLAALASVPISALVILWSIDATLVEHQRLRSEQSQVKRAGEPVRPPAPPTAPAAALPRRHLRPGYLMAGEIVSPAAVLEPAMATLQADCLALVKLGAERGTWARSAIAEGPDAPMKGEAWDRASRELQDLQLFYVKAGRNGGLQPMPGKPIAETVARLEAAR